MKKFRYRLERVLHFREIVRVEKQRELALRQQELQASVDHLAALAKAELELGLTDGEVLRVEDLGLKATYAAWIQDETVKTRLLIIDQQEKVEQARLAYIEAAKDAKTLATHREKKFGEYREDVLKHDEKTLDELATQRYQVRAGDD